MGQNSIIIKALAGQAKYSPGHLGIEKCKNCSYHFSLGKNLKGHIIRTHSRIKFQCNQYEKAFTQKGCLSAHIQFVHETYQFLCKKCTFKGNTRRYGPLRGSTSSSCGELWPLAEAFIALWPKKELIMLFWPIFGIFGVQ